MLQSAIKLAAKNMPIFPVHGIVNGRCSCQRSQCSSPGKHPVPYNGLKSATSNMAQVEQWWTQHPQANIGLVTGKVSGLVVVDIDPRNGGDESFSDLERQHRSFPGTKEVLTGGGGQHLYFRYPLSLAVPCKAGKTDPFRGFDAALAQEASDRGVNILRATEAKEILPRISVDPEHFESRFCDWKESCWQEALSHGF